MKVLLVNFGGPRNQAEIGPFLRELLCDQDLIQTRLPAPLHRLIFSRTARKRTGLVAHQYSQIGGGSPIYGDTERLAQELRQQLNVQLLTFHRYLPATHPSFIKEMEALTEDVLVFPLFPQFSYTTTGSAARWLARHLSPRTLSRLRWIRSYCDHPAWVDAVAAPLRSQHDATLLCSAHGLPVSYVEKGDPYQAECERSLRALLQRLPHLTGQLSYQSQFGKAEWLKPSTAQMCDQLTQRTLIVPLSFTSDHLETLYEIEEEYLPRLRQRGIAAERIPAIGLHAEWVLPLLHDRPNLCQTADLIRS
jgi:protoporphyrin/coproporphyrin ferrochelatase